jgi:hypothetical protein
MNDLGLNADISARYKPFLEMVLQHHQDKVHSIYLVGSALTQDYDAKTSDINSVVVLHQMDLTFLEFLAPLGKKYGKKRIAAPLIMTPAYIDNSLDVFPIEFLNIKLLHHTVFGEDIFQHAAIKKSDLRYQCERELKVKLIGLRQGYISASGSQRVLAKGFADSYAGYMPLFKAIIVLYGKEAPRNNLEILSDLEASTGIRLDVFRQVLNLKKRKTTPSIDQLKIVFQDYYEAIEKLEKITDALEV